MDERIQRIRREADRERAENGLSNRNVLKLLQIPAVREVVLRVADQGQKSKGGGGQQLRR